MNTLRRSLPRLRVVFSLPLLFLLVGLVWWCTPVRAQGDTSSTLFLPALMAGRTAPVEGDKTSADLIDEALTRNELNAEQALVYKVFASFGDPRLPAQYRGAGDEFDTLLMRDAAVRFPDLSPETQSLLAPFFQPPIYADSWYAGSSAAAAANVSPLADEECAADPGPAPIPPEGWGCIDGGIGTNFRVWWQLDAPADKARAEKITQAMEKDIWAKLVILMRRDPPSDKGPHKFTDLNGEDTVWWDGGDGKLDIYLITPPRGTGGAATLAYPPGCDLRPSFILVDPALDDKTLLPALTHEFFHTFQFGMDQKKQCAEWEWWSEATANWAIDFVYPADNWEHQWAHSYLQADYWSRSIFEGQRGGRTAYLLPLFLTKHLGDPGVIRRSWENAATFSTNSLAGIDAAVNGSLTDLWHEFVKTLPNDAPFDRWQAWDTLTYPIMGDYVSKDTARIETLGTTPDNRGIRKIYEPVELITAPDYRYDMPTGVPPLSSRAYRYRFQDTNARSVAFTNPGFFSPLPAGAKLLAYVKVAGQAWEFEDWTGKPARTFCRELPEEKLDELILIISNGQWQNREQKVELSPAPLLAITNIGCARWEGTVEAEIRVSNPAMDVTDTYRGTLIFAPRTDLPPEAVNNIWEYFDIVGGSITWERSGVAGGCTLSGGPETYSSPGDFNGNLDVAGYGVFKDIDDYRVHTGVLNLTTTGTYIMQCPTGTITDELSHSVFGTLGQGDKPITLDGQTLQGRHSESGGGASSVTTWKFTSKPK